MTAIDGWPVELADTAGLRTSDDSLEQAGVDRAVAELKAADLALLVFDVSRTWTDEMRQLVDKRRDAIVVHNKADLLPSDALEHGQVLRDRPDGVLVCAKTAGNLPALLGAIAERLVPDAPPPGEAVPFTIEQIEVLRAAIEYVQGKDLSRASAKLTALVRTSAR
jgi:tRNA modification GTPase